MGKRKKNRLIRQVSLPKQHHRGDSVISYIRQYILTQYDYIHVTNTQYGTNFLQADVTFRLTVKAFSMLIKVSGWGTVMLFGDQEDVLPG